LLRGRGCGLSCTAVAVDTTLIVEEVEQDFGQGQGVLPLEDLRPAWFGVGEEECDASEQEYEGVRGEFKEFRELFCGLKWAGSGSGFGRGLPMVGWLHGTSRDT